ncbi:MAG: hypothetical protein K2P84_13125 [Undibacterium sp.]|nr:hypothetical protein [Undibacterium sp.]
MNVRHLMTMLALLCASHSPLVLAQSKMPEECKNLNELQILPSSQIYQYQMRDTLQVQASGVCKDKIKAEWDKNASIALQFNGEKISELKTPPIIQTDPNQLLLQFELLRDSGNEINRSAWDRFLLKRTTQTVQISLIAGNQLAWRLAPGAEVLFEVTDSKIKWGVIIIGAFIFIAVYCCLMLNTKALQDDITGYYSLGKSQMAFWGLLVLISFIGIVIVTQRIESIPLEILVLLGISTSTGLSSVIIGSSKVTDAQERSKGLEDKKSNLESIANRTAEQDDSLKGVSEDLNKIKKNLKSVVENKGMGKFISFWSDICNDGTGFSFHRFQMVLWTITLGCLFITSVCNIITMPIFSGTLLTLMGISNGVYLGFKIPEKL